MNILVTGGLGYIGAHIVTQLIDTYNDCEVFILDNLSNSDLSKLYKIRASLKNKNSGNRIHFHQLDLATQPKELDEFLRYAEIDKVIHMAGLKAVGESVQLPEMYFSVNINSTLNLLNAMKHHGVKDIIFSSTASVYGNSKDHLTEESPVAPSNPYASTKYAIERLLEANALHHGFNVTILRYFNPIGCHEKLLIGEDPRGIPNNVVPYLTKSHNGKLSTFKIYGNDYDTPDGTGVRDYIHVVDLANAHIVALENMDGYRLYNVGTSIGVSVLELVNYLSEISERKVEYIIAGRRPGDVAKCVADPSKIAKELGWVAKYTVKDALKSHWEYELGNS